MYGFQGSPAGFQGSPAGWFPQGFQHPPNVQMMRGTTNAQVFPPPNAQFFSPTEMAPTSAQHEKPAEADDDEVAICTGQAAPTTRRKKSTSRTKLPNFNPDEDVYIVKSWLKISCDPIINTGQKASRMWDRILERYNMTRGSYPERSLRSLQSHWDDIKREAGKFATYYADAIRENPSGMSDADKTIYAAANFAAHYKHNFQFMHCWEIMKDEPKWQEPKHGGVGDDISHESNTIDLEDGNSGPARSAGKRPMGRDAAKAARKKANSSTGSASSSEYARGCKICHCKKYLSCKKKMCVKVIGSSSLLP